MLSDMQNTYELGANSALARNKVLRNTYALLALSMIPTVLGAFIGVQMHLVLPAGFMSLLLVLAVFYGFIYAIERNNDSGLGVVLLLAFTFVMGLLMTPLLTRTLGFANGGSLIMMAFTGTATIFAVMASWATVSKRDFSMIGKWMFVAVIVTMLAIVANVFLQLSVLSILISAVVILISSAFILYRVQQIVNGGETNYISATLGLYIDIYNIFTSLLNLLGLAGDRD